MKKLLLVGNKPIDFDLKLDYDSYDVICRVNKMDNYDRTGSRVDWYWICPSREYYMLNGGRFVEQGVLKDIKKLFCYYWHEKRIYRHYSRWNIPDEVMDDCEIVNPWIEKDIMRNAPMSTVLCLAHILNKYPEYRVTLACADIENRKKLGYRRRGCHDLYDLEEDERYMQNAVNKNIIDYIYVPDIDTCKNKIRKMSK